MQVNMGRCRVALIIGAVVASTATACAGETRAVIELFTSQGCSACPPADQLLGQLAHDPTLVAMSLPIDYWDYLGWKDTLAKPAHSARQRAYAQVRGDRAVYTPQAVVNGAMHVQGSDQAAIERAIVETRQQPGTLSVPVTVSVEGGRVNVQLPASADPQHSGAEVWLCALAQSIPIAIARGENRGRTLTYYNVVRRWLKLGEWNGAARTLSAPVSDLEPETADSVAVLVQAGNDEAPGRILGASVTSLR
jgi:hypothetical protein